MKIFGKEFGDVTKLQQDIAKKNQDYGILDQNFQAMLTTYLSKGTSDDFNPMGSMRPPADIPMISSDSGAKMGVFPFPLYHLYQMVKNIDALRIPIDVINREIHRNGFIVEPRFRYKCKNCRKEFKIKPLSSKSFIEETKEDDSKPDLVCDTCGGKDFREPNPKKRQILQDLIERKINNNNQTIKHVSKQLERDLDISDMCYLVLLKRYKKETDGTFRKSILDEIIRVHPAQVFLIADWDGRLGFDDQGTEVFFCPEHRTNGRVMRKRNHMGAEIDSEEIPR